MIDISIIVIGRNEERHIRATLRSALAASRTVPSSEVLYVDSASTDGTLTVARQFPVKIYQLEPDWPLSAAAGRYIGDHYASGRYVLFLDGDTLVYRSWLQKAIHFLDSHSEAGGVAGIVHEAVEDETGRVIQLRQNRYEQGNRIITVKSLGGNAVYRKTALDQAGSFNPYLSCDEEWELGMRLRDKRYVLFRIPSRMAITYNPPRDSLRELFRRRKGALFKYGKTLRYCQSEKRFWQYFRERILLMGRLGMSSFAIMIGFLISLPVLGITWSVAGLFAVMIMLTLMNRKRLRTFFSNWMRSLLFLMETWSSYRQTTIVYDRSSYPTQLRKLGGN